MPMTPGCQSSPLTTSTPVPGCGRVFQRLQRGGKYLLLGLLTLGVDLCQTVRNAGCLLLVPAEQQQAYHGVIHAARRVQAQAGL